MHVPYVINKRCITTYSLLSHTTINYWLTVVPLHRFRVLDASQENRLELSEFEIGTGKFYACLQDEIWERAYVEKVSGAPSPDGATCTMAVCYFVDNGAYMPLTVAATSIQPLHQQFRKLPRQAIQAQLHGVRPKEGAADFDPMDCITFQVSPAEKFIFLAFEIYSASEMYELHLLNSICIYAWWLC